MKTTDVLIGAALGLAAGAALGLLFAPSDGKTTRGKMVKTKDNLSQDLKEVISNGVKNLSDHLKSLSDKGGSMMQKGREKLVAVQNQY